MTAAARTRQEIFDLAWNGLKAQGFRQSADANGYCQYRGPDGLKCAIGHCIPDDRYSDKMEGERWIAFAHAGIDCGADFHFAIDLQLLHDGAGNPADMEARLSAFAAHHGLTIPS